MAGLRVIGGEAKGRRLVAPDLPGLRPTSDRVREAVFDVLEARGLVEGASVLDLFAGSGALGIEAISRGAGSAVLVESDARAARVIERNLAVLGELAGRGRVVRQEALVFLAGPGSARPQGAAGRFDVALVDPPYHFPGWDLLLGLLAPLASVAVFEHSNRLETSPHFQVIRLYRHGGTLLTLAEAVWAGGTA